MAFTYTSSIRKIRSVKSRKKVIQGGSSAGKTFAILAVLIDKAVKIPHSEISVVSNTVPHLRRGALRDSLKIMKETGRYIDRNYNKTNLTYNFSNGSYIEFFSVEDESKLRGARRHILYINEANNINYEAYQQLAIRTSGDIYVDFNPVARFWAHTEVLNEPDSELLILTYKDNEGLPNTVLHELEDKRIKARTSEYWMNWCRVYLDGEVGKLEGTIFQDYNIIDKIPEDAKLIGYGTDWGFTNDPTTLVALYRYDGKLLIDELLYQKGLMSGDYARMVKQLGLKETIYADSAEPRTIAEVKSYGINIQAVKKPRIKESLHMVLEYDIEVTSRSTNLIHEFDHYTWSDKHNNEPIDGFNHCIDAVRYCAWMKLGKNERTTKTPFRMVR